MLEGGGHMRLTVIWLLVLVIGSMLVGTAFAECVAMNMPCCSQHRSSNCHEICATPTGNISNATVPPPSGDLDAAATLEPMVAAPSVISIHVRPAFAPSAESLLTRIHVLQI